MKSDKERRQSPRVPPLICQVRGPRATPSFLGYVADLSAGGLRMSGGRRVRAGDHLRVAFTVPDKGRRVQCRGEVVWTKRLERKEGESEEIGIRFLGLDTKTKRALDAWITNQLRLL